jgi:uncharacterized membrane protein
LRATRAQEAAPCAVPETDIMSNNLSPAGLAQPTDESLVTYTHVIYALHALAVITGLAGTATVVGSFVGSIPSIVAVIMNYARRSAVRGTFLDSHFSWQIRTFWYAVLWLVVIWLISIPLMAILIGFPLFIAGHIALGIWIIYRVTRGWLALRDRRPMYVYA